MRPDVLIGDRSLDGTSGAVVTIRSAGRQIATLLTVVPLFPSHILITVETVV